MADQEGNNPHRNQTRDGPLNEFRALNFSSQREDRFPSVKERVRLYMTRWYTPPCREYHDGYIHFQFQTAHDLTPALRITESSDMVNSSTFELANIILRDHLFFLDSTNLNKCQTGNDSLLAELCIDCSRTLLPLMRQLSTTFDGFGKAPLLFQFGDRAVPLHYEQARIPYMKKYRSSMKREAVQRMTDQECTRSNAVYPISNEPIIWILGAARHYGNLPKVTKHDISWQDKKDQAIFWGGPNGPTDAVWRHQSDRERCFALPRCRLVYLYHNSSLVSAKLVTTRGLFADEIDGVRIIANGRLKVQDLLQYKVLIMMEGNDISSGLKWALFSNSVVMMPPPTLTSYAMEELLEPYVHYVPISSDLTDVEIQMNWILQNQAAAERIAMAGKNWINDLLYHEQAHKDNQSILIEILRRYHLHFRRVSVTP